MVASLTDAAKYGLVGGLWLVRKAKRASSRDDGTAGTVSFGSQRSD